MKTLVLVGLAICGMMTLFGGQSSAQQPAILGAADASNGAVVFPDANTPSTQKFVAGMHFNVKPHGVAYFGSDNALISDFGNSRIYVVKISTATATAVINTPLHYDGTGTIAVAPNLTAALAMGGNNTRLVVIRAPFGTTSTVAAVTLPGRIESYQTQAVVFNNAGRAFVYHTAGISVLDAPYTSVAFTIPIAFNARSGAIAISPDGNTLLVTNANDNFVRIFRAPFGPTSVPTSLSISNGGRLDGIMVAPNGEKALVVSASVHYAAAITAPFGSNSVVEELPLPSGPGTFEDVGISADSQLAILTGNHFSEPPVLIKAPFTAAGASASYVPIMGVNPGRGAGAVRFLPPGLAPGLTVSKSAPASVESGANLTYTISYSNTGTANATNVVIRDPLPAGTTFVSATNGGALSGGSVVFNVGNVNAGAAGQTVSFTVAVNTPSGGTVNNNNYTIEGDGISPIPGPPVTTSVSGTTPTPTPTPTPGAPTIQFSAPSYFVAEDRTFVTVHVTRSSSAGAATVDYATANGTASELSDYTTALGTLRFADGDAEESIDLLITEDSLAESNETFSVALSNPTGGAVLGAQSTAAVQIMEDPSEPAANSIDDAALFVGHHYHDFLNREPDQAGLAYWTDQITSCGSDAGCIDVKRQNVSTAFFLSIEFQQTGYKVIRIFRSTFTDSAGRPRGLPRYREFLRDTQEIGRGVVVGQGNWEQQIAANTLNFARAWVQRPDVVDPAVLPVTMTAQEFVDKLFLNSGVTPVQAERDAAIAAFGAGGTTGRADALLSVIETGSVYNRQYNPAFVLMQYIGYLRRNPNDAPEPNLDYAGFDFWLQKMDNHSLPGEDVRVNDVAFARAKRAEMVKAFILSTEYRQRFGQP